MQLLPQGPPLDHSQHGHEGQSHALGALARQIWRDQAQEIRAMLQHDGLNQSAYHRFDRLFAR